MGSITSIAGKQVFYLDRPGMSGESGWACEASTEHLSRIARGISRAYAVSTDHCSEFFGELAECGAPKIYIPVRELLLQVENTVSYHLMLGQFTDVQGHLKQVTRVFPACHSQIVIGTGFSRQVPPGSTGSSC